MNILVSTTRDWNLGDEIIWIGVKRLLKKIFDGSVNYFFYNRNPDMFPYRHLHGNYLTHVPDFIDLVVLAGTPEFYEEKMRGLYESVGDRPIWAIGIGWGTEHLVPNEFETEFIKRDNFRIIARSEETRKIIPKPIEVLPCPALLCSDKIEKTKKSCFVGQIGFNKTNESDIIVYCIPDFLEVKDRKVKYITEPEDLIAILGQYETVYTNRLHAGFTTIATGGNAIFVKSDFRIDTAVSTWRNYQGNLMEDYLTILNNWKIEQQW